MYRTRLILLALCVLFLAGCIPNKKVIYLQDTGYEERKTIGIDTVVNSFGLIDQEYRLQPDDIVSIKISSLTPTEYNFFAETEKEINEKNPLLSGFLIDQQGYIILPVIGSIQLQGLTTIEAQNTIQSLAADYLQDPTVNVRLLNFRFTILGEVNKPGNFNTYNSRLTIFDALGMANDLTDYADRSKVQLVRHKDGSAKVVYLNLLDDDILNSDYYYIQPNDLISVAPLRAKDYRQFQVVNIGLIISTITAVSLLLIRIN